MVIPAESDRLQRLAPFAAPRAEDFAQLPLLIKTQGKCTTDHISLAGHWLAYRGHLANISRNRLMGATNAFTGATNAVRHVATGEVGEVSAVAAS